MVGIAMGSGTALAQSSADIILMNSNLTALASIFQTAEKAQRIIKQNLAWALGYNLLALPFAAMGWIPPWLAAIGMSTSSLWVVFNSLRVLKDEH